MLRISPGNESNGNGFCLIMFGVSWSRRVDVSVAISFIEYLSIPVGNHLCEVLEEACIRGSRGVCSLLVGGEGGYKRRRRRLRSLVVGPTIHGSGQRLQSKVV